ncbi:MAG: hypothetical protein NVS1B13_10540 [Flavisolibacter sp.]
MRYESSHSFIILQINPICMNTNHLSDDQIFSNLILPQVKKYFPLSKIIAAKRVRDGFRVGFLRILDDPSTGIIQTWMIINQQPVLISEN